MKIVSRILVWLGALWVLLFNSLALWGFLSAFSAMRDAETNGIGVFSSSIDFAYKTLLISFIGLFVLFIGCFLLMIPTREAKS